MSDSNQLNSSSIKFRVDGFEYGILRILTTPAIIELRPTTFIKGSSSWNYDLLGILKDLIRLGLIPTDYSIKSVGYKL